MSNETISNAHGAEWSPETPPDIASGRSVGHLRACAWCGSMHPADVAAAIRAGARGSPADRKYGWPHKFYFDGIPNPHAGMLESRMSTSHAVPICPKSGVACEHGRQSFHHPQCECMVNSPESIVSGVDHPRCGDLVAVQTGLFNQRTGRPLRRWEERGKPAPATTYKKFYTEHLQDATPDDRETIERHIGMRIKFEGGSVSWAPYRQEVTG